MMASWWFTAGQRMELRVCLDLRQWRRGQRAHGSLAALSFGLTTEVSRLDLGVRDGGEAVLVWWCVGGEGHGEHGTAMGAAVSCGGSNGFFFPFSRSLSSIFSFSFSQPREHDKGELGDCGGFADEARAAGF